MTKLKSQILWILGNVPKPVIGNGLSKDCKVCNKKQTSKCKGRVSNEDINTLERRREKPVYRDEQESN
jgi:hypothetical protein